MNELSRPKLKVSHAKKITIHIYNIPHAQMFYEQNKKFD